MRLLITGGAGFIGSHLTQAALEAGHQVRVVDNLATGALWRIEPMLPHIEWLHGDISDPQVAAQAVEGVECILHQAAIPSVPRSVADPVASNNANVSGTIALLQAAREAGVRRLVYAASSSAYGRSPELPKVETIPPAPMSPYAVSKLAGEQYCQVFAGLGFLETVCLRYFNIFGPRQDPHSQYAAVIPKFITAALEGKPITVHGDGTQSRDFTYIDNAVQANLRALEAPDASGEVINVACGARHTLNDLIGELQALFGRELEVQYLAGRMGDVPHSLADISKARRLLGYEPAVSFRDGLARTLSWFQGAGEGADTGAG